MTHLTCCGSYHRPGQKAKEAAVPQWTEWTTHDNNLTGICTVTWNYKRSKFKIKV